MVGRVGAAQGPDPAVAAVQADELQVEGCPRVTGAAGGGQDGIRGWSGGCLGKASWREPGTAGYLPSARGFSVQNASG